MCNHEKNDGFILAVVNVWGDASHDRKNTHTQKKVCTETEEDWIKRQ